MTTPSKPLPRPTPESRAFWEGCKEHKLVLPRCGDCGRLHYYPRAICPHCWSRNLTQEQVSGRGKLYSYVISHRGTPAFQEDVPYSIAVVELDEGPRMLTNIVGLPQTPEDLVLDMALEVVFEEASEEITLPKFRPAS